MAAAVRHYGLVLRIDEITTATGRADATFRVVYRHSGTGGCSADHERPISAAAVRRRR
ncbi:hypothetical protein ACQPW3_26195 [Actinosynnema sp. CA-248983]